MGRVAARRAPLLIALLAVLALAACAAPGAPSTDPVKELRSAGTALGEIKSGAVDLKFGPGAALFGFDLVSATAKVKLPSDTDAVIKAKQQDSLIEIEVVSLGGNVYLRLPFIGFQQASAQEAAGLPSVGSVFDATNGLPAVLPSGKNPHVDGAETISGTDCWKISTTFTADQVAKAVQPLQPTGDIPSTLWIGKSDHLLRKAILTGHLFDATKKTSIEVRLHDFNANFNIVKPV